MLITHLDWYFSVMESDLWLQYQQLVIKVSNLSVIKIEIKFITTSNGRQDFYLILMEIMPMHFISLDLWSSSLPFFATQSVGLIVGKRTETKMTKILT